MITPLLLLISVQAQPTLPPHCSQKVYDLAVQIASRLRESSFSAAELLLRQWPSGEITYTVEGPAPSYIEGAEQSAIALFERASQGAIRFKRGDHAIVKLILVDDAIVVDEPPQWKEGVVVAKVALRFGKDRMPSNEYAVSRRIARAFGFTVGMAPTSVPGTVMGLDTTVESFGTLFLTQGEQALMTRILSYRESLSERISNKTSADLPQPKLETSTKSADVGIVQENENPYFEFQIKNAGTGVLELFPDMSCRCLSLSRLAPLNPGETKTIRILLDTRGLVGNIDKQIVFHTNDPANPVQEVRLLARIVPEYRVVPDNFPPVGLSDNGPTSVELYFYSTPGNAVRMERAVLENPHTRISTEPYLGEVFDPLFDTSPVKRVAQKITATFEKEFPAGITWVRLTVFTDSLHNPRREISFRIQKGLVAYPTTAFFGSVPVGVVASRTIKLTHPNIPFKVLSAVVESGPFEARVEPDGDSGKSHKLILDFVGKTAGQLNGKVNITTDCPGYERLSVVIIGNAI